MLTALLPVGGCAALLDVGGPCAFDPPPGDYSDVVVTNDVAGPVVLGLCDDDRCSRLDEARAVPAGASTTFNIESCSGGPIAVETSTGGRLLGCIEVSLPIDDDFRYLPPARVSQLRPCGSHQPSVVLHDE